MLWWRLKIKTTLKRIVDSCMVDRSGFFPLTSSLLCSSSHLVRGSNLPWQQAICQVDYQPTTGQGQWNIWKGEGPICHLHWGFWGFFRGGGQIGREILSGLIALVQSPNNKRKLDTLASRNFLVWCSLTYLSSPAWTMVHKYVPSEKWLLCSICHSAVIVLFIDWG